MTDKRFVNYDFWLRFDYTGSLKGPAPVATKGEPQTARGERAVRCSARLPLSLFATPTVTMTMDVPYFEAPNVIANVEAATDAFKQAIGLDVDMKIIARDEEGQ